jgi:hypothetical protein
MFASRSEARPENDAMPTAPIWATGALRALPRLVHRVRIRSAASQLLLLCVAIAASARTHRAAQPAAPDPGYVLALAAANHFLHAWQANDLETGIVLLSDSVRHSHDAAMLEQFFSGDSPRAFEITRGKGHPGRYSFPVVLSTVQGARVQRKFSEIVLVNTGKNDWVVDKLP